MWNPPAGGEPPSAVIFATGHLVHNALQAAVALEKEGIAVTVVNIHTIKPLDKETILALSKQAGAVVTVEEHQIAGGMGSAIAELLAAESPTPMEFIGMHDRYGQSGTPKELIEYYGMGASSIAAAVKKVISRK